MSVEMCFSYIGQFNFILSLLGSIPRVFQQIIPIPDQSVYVITGQYLACIPTDSPDTTRPVCLCDYWAVSRRYSNRSSWYQTSLFTCLLGSISRVFWQIVPIPDQSVYVITGQYLACIPTDPPDTRPVYLRDYWAVSRVYSNRSSWYQTSLFMWLLGSISRVFQQIVLIPDQSVYVITGQYLACIPTDRPDTRPVCLHDYCQLCLYSFENVPL